MQSPLRKGFTGDKNGAQCEISRTEAHSFTDGEFIKNAGEQSGFGIKILFNLIVRLMPVIDCKISGRIFRLKSDV